MGIKSRVVKISIGAGTVAISGVVVLVLALFIARPWNNALLKNMEHVLSSMEVHPSDSRVLKTYRFFGSRYSNTNECTFSVGEWRVSKLSPDDLRKIYTNPIVDTSLGGEKIPLGFMLIKEESELTLTDPPDGWHTTIREQIDDFAGEYTHYLLYLSISGRSSFGDLRCLEGDALEETRVRNS